MGPVDHLKCANKKKKTTAESPFVVFKSGHDSPCMPVFVYCTVSEKRPDLYHMQDHIATTTRLIHRSNTVSYIICNETLMLSHTSPTRLDRFFSCTVSNTVIYSAAILLLLDQRISTCSVQGSGTVDIQLSISLLCSAGYTCY